MAAQDQVVIEVIEGAVTTIVLIASGPPGPPGTGTGPAGPDGPQGADGPQGIQGIQGPPGNDGSDGQDGNQGVQGIQGPTGADGAIITNGNITTGSGAPDNGDGVDGDIYINTVNGDLYQKETGAWVLKTNIRGSQGIQGVQGVAGVDGVDGTDGAQGIQGIQGIAGVDGLQGVTGAQGADGRSIYSTNGVPLVGVGNNGDVAFDFTTGDVYDKAGGVWTFRISLVGPTGPNGTRWRSASGVPSNGLGVDTDFYLDSATGNYYEKAAGAYTLSGSLLGPQGIQGIQGVQGTAGTAGTIWRDGAGAPSNGLGANGDYYLNTTNGDVYFKAASVYSIVGNIKGATGNNGTNGQGVPVAGTANQVLSKVDATNYNTQWVTADKAFVGLANVTNTSDANKPVSTAQQTALDLKSDFTRTLVEYTASQTAVLADAKKIVEMNVATANVYTIPPNSAVAFPVGAQIDLTQTGAGQTSISGGVGVTTTSDSSKLKVGARYASITMYQRSLNVWNVSGNLAL